MARWIKPAGHFLYSSTCETTKSPAKGRAFCWTQRPCWPLLRWSLRLLAAPAGLVPDLTVLTWLLAGILTLLTLSRILVLLARLLALLAAALVALLVSLPFVEILFVCHRFVLLCCRRRNRQCNSASDRSYFRRLRVLHWKRDELPLTDDDDAWNKRG